MNLPGDYYSKRIDKVLVSLPREGVDCLLLNCPTNLAYLSGFEGHDSWGLISGKGRWLITDRRYYEQAVSEAGDFKIILRDKTSVFEIVNNLVMRNRFKRIGFESNAVSYHFFKNLRQRVGPRRLKATSEVVEKLREQKDTFEIKRIQRAVDITIDVFETIAKKIRVGISEAQIQGEFDCQARLKGAQKSSFDVIVAAGPSSAMPHYVTKHKKIGHNNPLLIDMGVMADGYCSDLTRNLFFGKIPVSYKRAYSAVLEAQEAAMSRIAPGVAVKVVDQACRTVLKRHGCARYFNHGTGHGVGMQVHESPSISGRTDNLLKEGMVVTVEPGVYFPGRFGIRIEDMVLVTSGGNKILSARLGKSLKTS